MAERRPSGLFNKIFSKDSEEASEYAELPAATPQSKPADLSKRPSFRLSFLKPSTDTVQRNTTADPDATTSVSSDYQTFPETNTTTSPPTTTTDDNSSSHQLVIYSTQHSTPPPSIQPNPAIRAPKWLKSLLAPKPKKRPRQQNVAASRFINPSSEETISSARRSLAATSQSLVSSSSSRPPSTGGSWHKRAQLAHLQPIRDGLLQRRALLFAQLNSAVSRKTHLMTCIQQQQQQQSNNG